MAEPIDTLLEFWGSQNPKLAFLHKTYEEQLTPQPDLNLVLKQMEQLRKSKDNKILGLQKQLEDTRQQQQQVLDEAKQKKAQADQKTRGGNIT